MPPGTLSHLEAWELMDVMDALMDVMGIMGAKKKHFSRPCSKVDRGLPPHPMC